MIFYGVVCSARQEAGNGCPFIAVLSMCCNDGSIFFRRKGAVVDGGAKLVAPTKAAGLPRPPWNTRTDERPVTSAVLFYELDELGVFIRAPRAFDSVSHHCCCCCYCYLNRMGVDFSYAYKEVAERKEEERKGRERGKEVVGTWHEP